MLPRPVHSFFRIIMPSAIKENKLALPKEFSERYGDELSNVIRLIVPAGGIWKVGLEKFGNVLLLSDGLQTFMDHHFILPGYFLILDYRGNSEFDVGVFDLICGEIQYPSCCNSSMPRYDMDSVVPENEEISDYAEVIEVEEEEDADDNNDDDASVEILDSPYANTRFRSLRNAASTEFSNQDRKRRTRPNTRFWSSRNAASRECSNQVSKRTRANTRFWSSRNAGFTDCSNQDGKRGTRANTRFNSQNAASTEWSSQVAEVHYPSSGISKMPRYDKDSVVSEEEGFSDDTKVLEVEKGKDEAHDDIDDDASVEILDSPFANTRFRSSRNAASTEFSNQVWKSRLRANTRVRPSRNTASREGTNQVSKSRTCANTRLRSSRNAASTEYTNQVSKRRKLANTRFRSLGYAAFTECSNQASKRSIQTTNLDHQPIRSSDACEPESSHHLNQDNCSKRHK